MDRVRDMVAVPAAPVRRTDEIGRLARSYYSMMERIQALLVKTREMEERKKELELKMLQSQISPHFLYNTLASVGSLARQSRIADVSATIRALVGVLEFTFDRTSQFVRVSDEISGLNSYMQIQKIRYGDRFRFVCEVQEEALGLSVLKLTLQPIVENAVFHGILPKGWRDGEIRVRGEVRRGKLRFVVRDNGAGMDPDRLAGLLERSEMTLPKERLTGIGVANVHERIRLYFGEPYGLRVRSLKGAGTIIVITLPARRLDTARGQLVP
jgi:sensor histidine kinase YesM